MVTEFRRLVFSLGELQDALETFNKDKTAIYPDGTIVEIKFTEETHVAALLQVNVSRSSKIRKIEVEVEADVLGAAMLHYCMENKIPIPKTSQKRVERVGDGLALSLSINAKSKSIKST